MISRLTYYISNSTDPYENIATEEYLTYNAAPDELVFFLWQNANTVVIGRNQNAWKECRVTELEADGGKLARRLSGGGAVYHDLGNLNFTFCMRKENVDLPRQMSVISSAAASFGLDAKCSGRNDATIDGRKFSGNAFFDSMGYYYHHGTILISVDAAALAKYLSPSKEKLVSKGVKSVHSRVVNLADLCNDITPLKMESALIRAIEDVYNVKSEVLDTSRLDTARIRESQRKFSSWQWKYGQTIPFTDSISRRFSWGEFELSMKVNSGIIEEALFSTDCLDANWFCDIGTMLRGCKYKAADICSALKAEMAKRSVPGSVQSELIDVIYRSI